MLSAQDWIKIWIQMQPRSSRGNIKLNAAERAFLFGGGENRDPLTRPITHGTGTRVRQGVLSTDGHSESGL